MADSTPILQMRHNRRSYMEVLKPSNKGYKLMGEGFTNLAESKNAKEYTRKYIHMVNEVSDVTGYAASLSYSCDVVSGDPVVDDILYITDNEIYGEGARRNIITYDEADLVDSGKIGASAGTYKTYKARKRTYAVIPDGSADGTDALVITGTLKAVSDIEYGKFMIQYTSSSNVTTGSFSQDDTLAPSSNGGGEIIVTLELGVTKLAASSVGSDSNATAMAALQNAITVSQVGSEVTISGNISACDAYTIDGVSHKYIGLVINTGLDSIVGAKLNDVELTQTDVTKASGYGAGAGCVVVFVDAEAAEYEAEHFAIEYESEIGELSVSFVSEN